MYYAEVGLIAFMVLIIENHDIMLNRNGAFNLSSWKVYRMFLYSVLFYYSTDIFWGVLEYYKLSRLLFIDTTIYFIAMATGVLLWSQFAVTYMKEKYRFGKFLLYSGRLIAASVVLLSFINVFTPILFTIDEAAVYTALPLRYVILAAQIFLLFMISAYAFYIIVNKNIKKGNDALKRYRTIALFGVIMVVFLIIQFWFPYLPLYTIAYLFGTCLLRAFLIGDEKERIRVELEETKKVAELKNTISALLNNMPSLSFYKDAETGVYLACNQAFAEYARKDSPEGVIGLTDFEIFDADTAAHFIEDDKKAMSMDEPYIFYEDVSDAAGEKRQFQTTKLKFTDESGRLCLLGMCQDITDIVRIRQENATAKEAYEKAVATGLISTHIAQALAYGFRVLYYVNIESGEYIVYRADIETGSLREERREKDFFENCKNEIDNLIYHEDRATVKKAMIRENLLNELNQSRSFFMTYRILTEDGAAYARMMVSRLEDERFVVMGIVNVDDEVKQQLANERIREEHASFHRLNALAGDFLCVYSVIPENGRYRELSATESFKGLNMPVEGSDFLSDFREKCKDIVYLEDTERFLSMFTIEYILSEINKNGMYALSLRMVFGDSPGYVQVKAALVEEADGRKLIVGISDIESLVRQEEDFSRRLSQMKKKVNTDALTGARTKYAYLDAEGKLDSLIESKQDVHFAVAICDINDLKKVNDTQGHQAGDRYIKDAFKIVSETFANSPVYRVGGDEFAVIVRDEDFESVDELVKKINDHNTFARENGGIVIACGMSKYSNDDCVADVYQRADLNMYDNKHLLKGQR